MTTWSYAEKRRLALAEAHQLRDEARAAARLLPAAEPDTPILGHLVAACPRCGGPLHIAARGRPLNAGHELRNVLHCHGTCRPLVLRLTIDIHKADQWEITAERRRAS